MNRRAHSRGDGLGESVEDAVQGVRTTNDVEFNVEDHELVGARDLRLELETRCILRRRERGSPHTLSLIHI